MPPTSVTQQELPVLLSENNSTEYSLEYSCSSLSGQSKTLYKQQSTPPILHELSPLVLKYKKQLPPCTNHLKPSFKEHHHKQDLKPD
jgi:hypothetical protein